MRSRNLSAALASGLALLDATSASVLHIASYTGELNTLNLTSTLSASGDDGPGQFVLSRSEVTRECGAQPSWLTQLDDILFCVNENFIGPGGNLAAFQILPDGGLSFLSNTTTLGGPVYATLYGNNKGLALANYASGSFQVFNIENPQNIFLVQNDTFKGTGPNTARQEQPHPHQVILDPTGNFFVVPDLGTDLVRIFRINQTTLRYAEAGELRAVPGSGPRHAAFVTTSFNRTYLYVVNELTNTLVGYDVSYNRNDTLGFRQIYSANTHGLNGTLPVGTSAAEIFASPDLKFVTVSSRNESSIQIPSPDNADEEIVSDPLITFRVNQQTGMLEHVQTIAAGGINPRHFSFNSDGTLVGVGLIDSSRVVVFNRNPREGTLGEIAAHLEQIGAPNNVLFVEN